MIDYYVLYGNGGNFHSALCSKMLHGGKKARYTRKKFTTPKKFFIKEIFSNKYFFINHRLQAQPDIVSFASFFIPFSTGPIFEKAVTKQIN